MVYWGIERDALGLDDPPVVLLDSSRHAGWRREAETTSGFALQCVALNAKFSGAPFHFANGAATEVALRAIEDALPRLPLAELSWPTEATRFHGHEDVIVECDGDEWLCVTARTAASFAVVEDIARATGVEWEYWQTPKRGR